MNGAPLAVLEQRLVARGLLAAGQRDLSFSLARDAAAYAAAHGRPSVGAACVPPGSHTPVSSGGADAPPQHTPLGAHR